MILSSSQLQKRDDQGGPMKRLVHFHLISGTIKSIMLVPRSGIFHFSPFFLACVCVCVETESSMFTHTHTHLAELKIALFYQAPQETRLVFMSDSAVLMMNKTAELVRVL